MSGTFASPLRGILRQAIHVKIRPRPHTLAESTGVLRVLQEYGEIFYFKHLRHETERPAYRSAIAIYQEESSAEKAINASPLKFKLEVKNVDWTPSESTPAADDTEEGDDNETKISRTKEERDKTGTVLQMGEDISHAQEDDDISDELNTDPRKKMSGQQSDGGKSLQDLGNRSKLGSVIESAQAVSELNHPATQTFSAYPSSLPSFNESPEIPLPPPSSTLDTHPSTQLLEFSLTIQPSCLDHQSYIEQQGYYGNFNPDTRSVMAGDLADRVPLQGLLDCHVAREEAPFRVVAKWKDRARQIRPTLMEMWKQGRMKRGETQLENQTHLEGKL